MRYPLLMIGGLVLALLTAVWLMHRGMNVVLSIFAPIAAVCYVGYRLERPDELQRERKAKGLCVRCGYDLTSNVSGVCPECGAAHWGMVK